MDVSGCKHPHNLKRLVAIQPRHLRANDENAGVARKLLLSGQRLNSKVVVAHRCAPALRAAVDRAGGVCRRVVLFLLLEMNP